LKHKRPETAFSVAYASLCAVDIHDMGELHGVALLVDEVAAHFIDLALCVRRSSKAKCRNYQYRCLLDEFV
jgi:hypothetical protein